MKKPKRNLQTLGHDTGDLKASLDVLSPPCTAAACNETRASSGHRCPQPAVAPPEQPGQCWGRHGAPSDSLQNVLCFYP